MTNISIEFTVGAAVHVDGDASLVGTVTAAIWRGGETFMYEVSWIHNGESRSFTIEGWRLSGTESA